MKIYSEPQTGTIAIVDMPTDEIGIITNWRLPNPLTKDYTKDYTGYLIIRQQAFQDNNTVFSIFSPPNRVGVVCPIDRFLIEPLQYRVRMLLPGTKIEI